MTDISDILKFKGVVLYGKNQSTYKMALGDLLIRYAAGNFEKVEMSKVALDFRTFYEPHVLPQEGKLPTRQLKQPFKTSSIEKAILQHDAGKINDEQSIQFIMDNCLLASSVVLPRFNTIQTKKISEPFYTFDKNFLHLNDNIRNIFASDENMWLLTKVRARFANQQEVFSRGEFSTNMTWSEQKKWIMNGSTRTNVSKFRDSLSPYQDDKCFLCGKSYAGEETEVDHLIPRDIMLHDELWNLEVAHEFCNQQKDHDMPDKRYIEKIITRNESVCQSEHPLKQKIQDEAGKTPQERRSHVVNEYKKAKMDFNRTTFYIDTDSITDYTKIRKYTDSLP